MSPWEKARFAGDSCDDFCLRYGTSPRKNVENQEKEEVFTIGDQWQTSSHHVETYSDSNMLECLVKTKLVSEK